MLRAVHGGLLVPRKVPGSLLHPDGQAMRREGRVSHPRPQLWTAACRAQGLSCNVCSSPPLVPYSFLAPAPGWPLSRQTSHYKAFSAGTPTPLPDPRLHSRVIHPLPWSPSTGGSSVGDQALLLCACLTRQDGHFQY